MADTKKNMTLDDFDELVNNRTTNMRGSCDTYLHSHDAVFLTKEDDVQDSQLVKLVTRSEWEEEDNTTWATLNHVSITYLYNDWGKLKSREWVLSRKDCRTLVSKLQGILDAADALDEHVKAMPACREASIEATEDKAA